MRFHTPSYKRPQRRQSLAGLSRLAGLQDDYASALEKWRNSLTDLDRAQSALLNAYDLAQKDPKDATAWQNEMDKVNGMYSTISTIKDGVNVVEEALSRGWQGWSDVIESATSWIGDVTGLFGIRGAGLGALNAIPLIPIATILAISAAVGALVFEINQFVQYLTAKWTRESVASRADQLVSQGMSRQAAQVQAQVEATNAAQLTAPTFTADIASVLKWSAFAVITFFVLPKLRK